MSARHWNSPYTGMMPPGSEAHKLAVCRMFKETFNPYKPSVIDWPKLDPETLHRVTSLPIWDIAVQTEGKATLRMNAYAAVLGRSGDARGDSAEWVGRKQAQGSAVEAGGSVWNQALRRNRSIKCRAMRNGLIS